MQTIYKVWSASPSGHSNLENGENLSQRPSSKDHAIAHPPCALLIHLVQDAPPPAEGKRHAGGDCTSFLHFVKSFLAHNKSFWSNKWTELTHYCIGESRPPTGSLCWDQDTVTLWKVGREARAVGPSYPDTLLHLVALPQRQWEGTSMPGHQGWLPSNVLALDLLALGLLWFTLWPMSSQFLKEWRQEVPGPSAKMII